MAEDADIPKILAIAIVSGGGLVTRFGLSYLKMRKDARKAGKWFYQGMLSNGIPKEYAQRLREEYEDGLSLETLIRAGMDVARSHDND